MTLGLLFCLCDGLTFKRNRGSGATDGFISEKYNAEREAIAKAKILVKIQSKTSQDPEICRNMDRKRAIWARRNILRNGFK